jgi:hypothetical protein
MSDTLDELFASVVMGGAFMLYLWRKRMTQFGSPRSFVKVYMSDRPLHCHVCRPVRPR